MVRQNAIERWETKLSNAEITPHAIWPLVKSLKRGDKPKAPSAIRSPTGLKFLPFEKANVTADCLESQLSPHDLCEEHHEQQVVVRILALFEAVHNSPPERVRPCDVQKIKNPLKLRKASGIGDTPNECLRQLPRKPLVHLTHLFDHCLRLSHLPSSWKEVKDSLTKTRQGPKIPSKPETTKPPTYNGQTI